MIPSQNIEKNTIDIENPLEITGEMLNTFGSIGIHLVSF